MNEPERLSLVAELDLERLLLRSGRAPAPAGARHRAMVAATAAFGASTMAAGSASASGLGAKLGSILSLKWIAIVGVASIGTMAGAAAMLDDPPSREARPVLDAPASVVPTRAPIAPPRPERLPFVLSPSAPVDAPLAETATAAAPSHAPSTPRARAPRAESIRSNEPSVRAELATLEQARSALASGDAPRALSLLDAYAARFPGGTMALEATVLRIEALVRAGDVTAAQRAGNAFLASRPQSPYSTRVRSLIGAPNP